jgi:murein DD-endopeptidase MepM/ murein hydrolase activator NlpD
MAGSGSQTVSSGQSMSYALYMSAGGRLTCGFDGYVNTKGRHEGIDFARGYGSAVYSLTDGVITRVVEGYNGSSGLSLIAIYSSATNKTVLYLHTDPLNSLKEGQYISRGQQIATEAWRGCSSSGGTHTHVEVRDGRKTSAAKSVNDYTLSNANPTAFWNSQGYQVK